VRWMSGSSDCTRQIIRCPKIRAIDRFQGIRDSEEEQPGYNKRLRTLTTQLAHFIAVAAGDRGGSACLPAGGDLPGASAGPAPGVGRRGAGVIAASTLAGYLAAITLLMVTPGPDMM
jgi:hypothetical protein